jgi:hypothetical protein
MNQGIVGQVLIKKTPSKKVHVSVPLTDFGEKNSFSPKR